MSTLSTPHDTLFRAILEDRDRAAALIREYLPPETAALLADAPPESVDGSFIDAKLRSTQSDRLFRVKTKSGAAAYVYILLEHKSHPDRNTPLQVAEYMLRIWRRHRSEKTSGPLPPIVPLVLYHGLPDWTVPTCLADCIDAEGPLREMAQSFRYVLQDLTHRDYEALSADQSVRAGLAALRFVFDPATTAEIVYRIVRDAPVDTVFMFQIFEYIGHSYDVPAESLIDAIRRAKPHREDEFMATPAQQWRAEGRAEGISIGASDALIRSVLRTLGRRFGPVSQATEARVGAKPTSELDDLLDRAITAPSLEAVFEDTGPN